MDWQWIWSKNYITNITLIFLALFSSHRIVIILIICLGREPCHTFRDSKRLQQQNSFCSQKNTSKLGRFIHFRRTRKCLLFYGNSTCINIIHLVFAYEIQAPWTPLDTDKLTDKQKTNRQTDKQTNRQTDKRTNRQTNKKTNWQTDIKT